MIFTFDVVVVRQCRIELRIIPVNIHIDSFAGNNFVVNINCEELSVICETQSKNNYNVPRGTL